MYQHDLLIEIIKKAQGDNSLNEFSRLSDIDSAYLSRIINKKRTNPPSPKILEKLARVSKWITTYEELMQICGYLDSPNSAAYDFSSESDQSSIDTIINYAVLKGIDINKLTSDKYILNLLDNLETLDKNIALNLIKNEVNKFQANNQKIEVLSSNSATVFIYGTIPAGVPMECIEDIIDTEEIDASMLKGGKQYFGLKIKGDSMYPEYLDKDIIILRKQDVCESGDDCVVMVNGDDGTFKRVFKNENGIILQPLNNSHQPTIYTNEQVESLPVRILGKVVELRRKK